MCPRVKDFARCALLLNLYLNLLFAPDIGKKKIAGLTFWHRVWPQLQLLHGYPKLGEQAQIVVVAVWRKVFQEQNKSVS